MFGRKANDEDFITNEWNIIVDSKKWTDADDDANSLIIIVFINLIYSSPLRDFHTDIFLVLDTMSGISKKLLDDCFISRVDGWEMNDVIIIM